jgi:L-ascorbate metabolism protein UlaG (beta-lactamase superfamily)
MIAADKIETPEGDLTIQPIDHASLVLLHGGHAIYVDPVGPAERYAGLPAPTGILITHEHGDHFSPETLAALTSARTPPVVSAEGSAAKLAGPLKDRTTIVGYGDAATLDGFAIETIEAHNTTPDRMRYHPVGLGNGYVIAIGGKRIYVAGDTEPNDAIRGLKEIDVAFLPMNLPYTMVAEQAAELVQAFRPGIVYPFHYAGGPEPEKFAQLMRGFPGIDVRLRDWYAQSR